MMSLKFRLIWAFTISSTLTILILATVLGISLHNDATISFRESAKEDLTAKREQKVWQIQNLISLVRNQLTLEASSDQVQQATLAFTQSFLELKTNSSEFSAPNDKLNRYYKNEFGAEFLR